MKIRINNISLFYTKSGAGPPIILLHGNGEDHSIFSELAAKLAAYYTVYSVDSRNHGQSNITDDYSYETMSKDIYEFIKALSLDPVNIVGFSDGAIIALLLAIKHNDCLLKMALLGANLKPEDFYEDILNEIQEEYEKTHAPLLKLMLEQPSIELDELTNIETPTLLVSAEDELFKPELYQSLLNSLKNSVHKIMSGHTHDSYISHNDILFSDLYAFFNN